MRPSPPVSRAVLLSRRKRLVRKRPALLSRPSCARRARGRDAADPAVLPSRSPALRRSLPIRPTRRPPLLTSSGGSALPLHPASRSRHLADAVACARGPRSETDATTGRQCPRRHAASLGLIGEASPLDDAAVLVNAHGVLRPRAQRAPTTGWTAGAGRLLLSETSAQWQSTSGCRTNVRARAGRKLRHLNATWGSARCMPMPVIQ